MFSIVVPIKNEEKYINRLIDSIFNQDEDVEILIFDNCSTDSTLNKIIEYQDPRIKVYENCVGAIHQFCSIGIKETAGEIITIIGGDDFFLPNAFKKVKEVISSGWVIGRVVQENGVVSKLDNPEVIMGQGIFWSRKFLEKNNLKHEWKEYPNICDYILKKKSWKIQSPAIIDDVIAFANLSRYTLHNKKERYLEMKMFRQEIND